jgi:hypothetical protein
MSAQPLSQPVDRIRPILDARTIAPLSHAEAGALARVELEHFLQLLEALGPEDWECPTLCTAWSVRDILAHQAGAYSAGASFAELRVSSPKPLGQAEAHGVARDRSWM